MAVRIAPIASVLALLTIVGCASAIKNGQSTALTGVDLVSMTDDMAGKIGSDAAVNAAAANGPLKIVVLPVVNELRAEIIPAGQANAFTGRVRVLMAKHAPDRFVWCMNRDAFYDLQRRELDLGIDPGPSPDRVQPEYALTATFSSLTDETRKRRDTFYVCAFQLTNLKSSAVLWAGSYEVKKEAVKGFLD
ncbi:MAG TPA: hypothetical protein VF595_04490 [Tepidisphaeraceae bacterium]|jgi:hypothetical protein